MYSSFKGHSKLGFSSDCFFFKGLSDFVPLWPLWPAVRCFLPSIRFDGSSVAAHLKVLPWTGSRETICFKTSL